MAVQTFKKGLRAGLMTTWSLGKVIFPITMIVGVLKHTPIMPWLIDLVTPFMSVLGLSGDAAIPLVFGNVINLYAAIGAILTMEFTVKEVFIMAVMLSFSHNLFVESSVAKKVGVKLWVAVLVRISLAAFSAVIIHHVWNGGDEIAKYGLISSQGGQITGVLPVLWDAFSTACVGILQLAMIVIPLMMGIQILKDIGWLAKFSKWMAPVTRMLGMKENTSTTLAAGLVFGLAYGAGVMIQAVKEDGVSKEDATLAFIFLATCHAVIEDTLIFVPLGIPVWALLLLRLTLAVIVTMTTANVWKRVKLAKRKEITYES